MINIQDIINTLINLDNPKPNDYGIKFDDMTLKDVFEFLLEFITELFKHFHGDEYGKVDLSTLSEHDMDNIKKYITYIGFTCKIKILPANSANITYIHNNNYKNKQTTKLRDMLFGIQCNTQLYIISFDFY